MWGKKTKKHCINSKFRLIVLFFLLSIFICQCNPWNIRKDLIDFRHRIQQAEKLDMKEAALYHLTIAKNLLEAAEKQYEEADFTAANKFIKQADKQYQKARKLYMLYHQPDTIDAGVKP